MERDNPFKVGVMNPAARSIVERLEAAGYKAYLVGGCVRDMLLGASPADYDVATDALPETVQELFPRTIPTGIRHGTVSVLVGEERIEVTTFRSEREYVDARRPACVEFVDSLEADLSRRDFTINAMACDLEGSIIDPFDGRNDLEHRIIRAVGVPEQRFREDALRMLRAIRFAATLNFTVEQHTWEAIKRNGELLGRISRERIRDEWNKIVLADLSLGVKLLIESHLFRFVFPDLHSLSDKMLLAAAEFANRLPKSISLRHAAFFRMLSLTESDAQKLLQYLRQPGTVIRFVSSILQAIPDDDPEIWPETRWRKYLFDHGKDVSLDAMRIAGQMRPQHAQRILDKLMESITKQQVWSLHDLAITGKDLIVELHIPPGPVIGQIRTELTNLVLEDPSVNSRDSLLAAAREIYKKLTDSTGRYDCT